MTRALLVPPCWPANSRNNYGAVQRRPTLQRHRLFMQRRAVIDIGTNSVKLLVADVDGVAVSPLVEESEQTRLGAGFYETRELQQDAIRRTASAVKTYADKAAKLD